MFDVGVTPAVAINSSGVIVEVHKSEAKDNLWYWVGRLMPMTHEIEWSSHAKYDKVRLNELSSFFSQFLFDSFVLVF